MKKLFGFLLIFTLAFSLAACGSEETSGEKKKSGKTNSKVLTEAEFTKMLSNPKKYKDRKVEYYGRVFVEPEKDEDGTYLQVYADDNDDKNTIVGIDDPDLKVKSDDIIHITGTVKDEFEGENLMGGEVTAPMIKADKIEISDYATAFAPAIKTIDINKEINQHGYILTLQKLELAEKEARLYVKITNNSKDKITFYSFDTKLVMNGKQYEESDNYSSNYPEIQSEILPGVTTEGIIAFDALPETGTLKAMLEGSSDNYELDFKPFEFEIKY